MARVLAVDDDDVIRSLLVMNLEMEGHDVLTAADGREALDTIEAGSPDLVLLDIMMPELSGYDVLERLRKDPRHQRLPVVFLSARAMEADVRKGMSLGVDRYVTKPFDPIDLMELVAELLAERGVQ